MPLPCCSDAPAASDEQPCISWLPARRRVLSSASATGQVVATEMAVISGSAPPGETGNAACILTDSRVWRRVCLGHLGLGGRPLRMPGRPARRAQAWGLGTCSLLHHGQVACASNVALYSLICCVKAAAATGEEDIQAEILEILCRGRPPASQVAHAGALAGGSQCRAGLLKQPLIPHG